MSTFKKIATNLREALAGKEHDYTAISVNKAIFLLAIPMVVEMLMESLFAVVDIYFVGKVSTEAVAAVGFTESMMTIIYSIAFGVAMAITAMVSRRIGEKDVEGATKVAGQAIVVGFILAAGFSVAGIFFSRELLALVGADEAVVETGHSYTQWLMGGNFVIMFIFMFNAIFRGAGDAALAMRVLILSNSLNLILDPLLIFGLGPIPAMGVEGAAIATNIGRTVGVSFQLYLLFGPRGVIRLKTSDLIPNWSIIRKKLSISAGGAGQFIIASASWLFLMKIMSRFGSEAVAGYTIAIRVLIFTILPAWGIANAAATLVGQNLGAQQPDRAEKSVWKSAFYCMIFMGIVSIGYIAFADQVIALFNDDALVVKHGSAALTFISVSYVLFAYGMVISQAFNGAGDTRTPTLMNLICFWFIQIPLAYFLAVSIEMESHGVYLAIVIAESVLAGLCIYLFRKGKWKLTKI